jgi:hypothetical protein
MGCLFFDHFNSVSNVIDVVIVTSTVLALDLRNQTLAD